MTPPLRRLALWEQFRCRGPDCEATCCAGWTVPVEDGDRSRWIAAGNQTALEAVIDGPAGPQMRLTCRSGASQGQCAMLTAEGWCGLQQRGGEPALPYACTVFPRVPRRWPDAVEVSASMACPEVARLVYADSGSLRWQAAVPQDVPRQRVVADTRPPAEQQAARRIQAWLLGIVSEEHTPLHDRLLRIIAAVVPLQGPAPADVVALAARLGSLPPTWRADVAAWSLRLPVELALAWIDGALGARLAVEGLADLGRRVGRLADRASEVKAAAVAHRALVEPLFTQHLRYLLVESVPAGEPVSWLQTVLLHACAVRACALALPDPPSDADGWCARVAEISWRFARDVEHAVGGAEASPWTAPASLRTAGGLVLLAAV